MDKYFSISAVSLQDGHFATITTDVTRAMRAEIVLTAKNEEYRTINAELQKTTALLRMQYTELKAAENALKHSQARYRGLLDNLGTGVIVFAPDTSVIMCNPKASELLGLTEDQLKDTVAADPMWHFIHDDGTTMHLSEYPVNRILATRSPMQTQVLGIRQPDTDRIVWVTANGFPLLDGDGDVSEILISFIDITERKIAEETHRTISERNRITLQTAINGYWLSDVNGNIIDVNDAYCAMSGYTRHELLNMRIEDLVATEKPSEIQHRIKRIIDRGSERFISAHRHKDGSIIDVEVSVQYLPTAEHHIVAFLRDITEIRKNEMALRESQERLKYTMEGSGLGDWDWDLRTNVVKRNERWAEMLGYALDEIAPTLQQAIDLQHPDDRDTSATAILDHLEGRTPSYSVQYRMRTKSGAYKWIHDCGKIMERDEHLHPVRFCGTHADIDELKQSERLVSTAKNILSAILESSPEVIVFALDTQYRYLAFNSRHKAAIEQIWGKEIAVGMNMLDVIGSHEDALKARANYDRALSGESFIVVEDYGDAQLCRQSWLDYWSPIRTADGHIIGLTCFVLNNTEQKRGEEKIRALLAEKELILKEVHHRIKNNMNTISSLLSLQAGAMPDQAGVNALKDAGNRIRSMSLLYDRLYQSTDYSSVSLMYYLPDLVQDVVTNFPNGGAVTIQQDVQDFRLDARLMQPLGIIVNELVTNAMKYAFQGRQTGTIRVTAANVDGHVTVSIQDDGVGMPESVSGTDSTGFGLQLVHALAAQIGGTMRIERGSGTTVGVEFDV